MRKKFNLPRCLLVMALVAFPMLNSCNDDDDYYLVGLATVNVVSGNTYYLEIDNGKKLWPAETDVPWYEAIDGKRVIAYFTPLDGGREGYDAAVRVVFLRSVLTKQVEELTADNEEMYGNDAVSVYDMWIGGDYLNVEFSYYMSGAEAHRVSLVVNTTEEQPEDGYMHLEYRYNDQDDVSSYRRMGLVSFFLGGYAPSADTTYKGIKVKINSIVNGEKELTIDYPEPNSGQNAREIDNADELDETDKVI